VRLVAVGGQPYRLIGAPGGRARRELPAANERHLEAATARWLGGDGSRVCAVSLDLFVDEAEAESTAGTVLRPPSS
jgi:hypothetical protein